MKVRLLFLAAGCFLNAMPVTARSDDDVFQWLDRMSAAMSQMHYQGTFVYLQGNSAETVRITHLVDERGSRERLVSVSGVPREVFRDSAGVLWTSGEDHTVMADSAFTPTFFPELPTDGISEAAASYQFSLEDGQRIASHRTHRVNIKPHDEYRYGYRLWLEEQSGLLLQWELVGSKGESLAKLMFTEMKMGAEVDPGELRDAAGGQAMPRPAPQSTQAARKINSKPTWQAVRLPPGFRLASRRQSQSGQAPVFEHLVYSDGIAAVSVYVESRDEEDELAQGLSTLGTTNTLSRRVNGEMVTVLGDVPVATIRMIGESVQPVKD